MSAICTNNYNQWRSQVFQSAGTWKTGLAGGLSRAPYAQVLWGIWGPSLPREKNWIWDCRRCNFPLSWGACLHLSIFCHVFNSSTSPPTSTPPSLFLRKFRQITRPIFSNSEGYVPQDFLWLRQWQRGDTNICSIHCFLIQCPAVNK